MTNGIFHRRFILIALMAALGAMALVRGFVTDVEGVHDNTFRDPGVTSQFIQDTDRGG